MLNFSIINIVYSIIDFNLRYAIILSKIFQKWSFYVLITNVIQKNGNFIKKTWFHAWSSWIQFRTIFLLSQRTPETVDEQPPKKKYDKAWLVSIWHNFDTRYEKGYFCYIFAAKISFFIRLQVMPKQITGTSPINAEYQLSASCP